MDTLVTLGTAAAIIMSIFLLILYSVEEGFTTKVEYNEEGDDKRVEKIEKLKFLMETAVLLITIITIGKYIEGKAKSSIMKMAN